MNNIPTITKNLLIINVLVYLATVALETIAGIDLNSLLGLHFFLAPNFHIYQLFTYMFAHGGLSHLFFNMFALWMFGCIVERTCGTRRFLAYYMACGVGAGLFQEAAQYVEFAYITAGHFGSISEAAAAYAYILQLWTTVGASGAVYGILLAFGMFYPEERIFIFPLPVPIKAKWFVMIYAALELFLSFGTSNDGVAHLAHLGGMVVGYLIIRHWRRQQGAPDGGGGGFTVINNLRRPKRDNTRTGGNSTGAHDNYTRYNANNAHDTSDNASEERRKAIREETERILDKIRRSGYDSLTREEKNKLFENSKNQ